MSTAHTQTVGNNKTNSMNYKSLVKLSNTIGVVSIILLVYWVFSFITIQVFGLKIFQENITETFYFSIIGILALMTGALFINLMFNLTRIAEKHNLDKTLDKKFSKKILSVIALSFPLIFALLMGGDYLTSQNKQEMLISSAHEIIEDNTHKASIIANYSFEKEWVEKTSEILDVVSSIDENFPEVQVIVKDEIDKTDVFLGFRYYRTRLNDSIPMQKIDYVQKTSQEERDYLNAVFKGQNLEKRFRANDGNYELFYPYSINNKTVVFYFSDYRKYGKLGS